MTASGPHVSVVIPCLDAGPMIERCLASCARQGRIGVEIVLVDNNCTDDSVARARAVARDRGLDLSVVACAEPGQNAALNVGFERASGDYVQWLDADDELGPGKLAAQVACLEATPEADIAYCGWEWRFFEDGRPSGRLEFPDREAEDILLELLIDRWRPYHAYLLRRRAAEALNARGMWNEATPLAKDREYFTAAAILGHRFRYVPECHVAYNHWSDSQISRSAPHERRAASVATMFDFFRQLADGNGAVSGRMHRALLDQDWTPLSPAPRGGATLDRAADAVARLLADETAARPLEDWARIAVRRLWNACLRAPDADRSLFGVAAAVRAALGLEREVEPSDAPDLFPLYQGGAIPLYAPVLWREHLHAWTVARRLVEAGVLAGAPR